MQAVRQGGKYMEKFTIGLLLGMTAGAVLTANNYKMRALVRKGQQEVKAKFDEILEEKLQDEDEQPTKRKRSEK
jgi:hypothetical protein